MLEFDLLFLLISRLFYALICTQESVPDSRNFENLRAQSMRELFLVAIQPGNSKERINQSKLSISIHSLFYYPWW